MGAGLGGERIFWGQPEWVSVGNDAADFLANRGREGARGVRGEVIRGFGMYGIFDGDGPVEGNVRDTGLGTRFGKERRREGEMGAAVSPGQIY